MSLLCHVYINAVKRICKTNDKVKLHLSKQALQTGKMHFANRRNLTHKKSDCYGDALDVTIKKQSKQKILGNHCLLNT